MNIMLGRLARGGSLAKRESPPTVSLAVWDLPTRLYHWLQAVLVTAALLTGYFAPKSWFSFHVWLGYAIGGLILFRLVWGFFGSEHSRFASFIFPPRRVVEHVRGLIVGPHKHSIGHNPLGSLMVFAMIAVIAGVLATGLIALGGQENQGALAGFVNFNFGTLARHAHSAGAALLIAMIVAHLAGVLVESLIERRSLVTAMITGRKQLPDDLAAAGPLPRLPRWGLAAISLVTAGGAIIVAGAFASRVPPSGIIAMPELAAYKTECGACHEPYHPSLLPRASWSVLMANLSDHFGEDASLDPATTKAIADWLDRYASEAWDTKAANWLRDVDPADPTRITATRFWQWRHHRIPKAIFESPEVGAPSNCAACHRDATTGRFDAQMINVPEAAEGE